MFKNTAFFLFYVSSCSTRPSVGGATAKVTAVLIFACRRRRHDRLLLLLLLLSSVCMCRNQTETLQLDKWVTIQFTSTSEPLNHARPIFPPQSNIPLHQTANNTVSVTCLHVLHALQQLLKQITALIMRAAFSASCSHVFTLCDENLIPHS